MGPGTKRYSKNIELTIERAKQAEERIKMESISTNPVVSDYEQQAIDFLAKTETTLQVDFVKHGVHFEGDKETRDIYKFTLTRGSRSYSGNFGQSINESLYAITELYGDRLLRPSFLIGKPKVTNKTGDKLFSKRSIEIPIEQIRNRGDARKRLETDQEIRARKNLVPNAYDILSCLTKSDPGFFTSFCDDFGYSPDSKKAEKIYEAVKAEYLGLCALFTDNEMEELQEIN